MSNTQFMFLNSIYEYSVPSTELHLKLYATRNNLKAGPLAGELFLRNYTQILENIHKTICSYIIYRKFACVFRKL